jgi:hypothetical protein
VPSDLVGAVFGLAVLTYAVYAYRGLEGYTGSLWWSLEAASVLLAIAAMWLDAFRYRANWYAWSLSNLCFLARRLPRRALGPVRDDVRLPGDQRRRLVPMDARPAPNGAHA